jgi:hypothetical protein
MPYNVDFLTKDDIVKYLIAQGILCAAGGPRKNVVVKTGDYTIDTADIPSGTIFTNRGAAGAVNFTLPAPTRALEGVYYDFIGVADQTITVTAATADTLIAHNDTAADSLAMSTAGDKIANGIRAVCDGTSWIAYGITPGPGGDTTTNVFTVAT